MRKLSLMERQGARIVAACTNCRWVQLDPGGGSKPGLPDFELHNSHDQRIGVLEVTSTITGELAKFVALQRKTPLLTDIRLRCYWFVMFHSTPGNVKTLRAKLVTLLVQAEESALGAHGGWVHTPGLGIVETQEPQKSLVDIGVWILQSLPAPRGQPGAVFIKPPARGGAIGPSLVTKEIQNVLARGDNLEKLAAFDDLNRRELFVWLTEGSTAAMALCSPRISPQFKSSYPTDGPQLPDPVTRVWAATGPNDQDVLARALWVADSGVWTVVPSLPRLETE